MKATKQALRAAERSRRKDKDAAYWRGIGVAVEQALREQLQLWRWDDVLLAGFAALPGEPILGELPGRMAWPCVVGDDLVFRACAHDDLVPGWRGILEPPTTAPVVCPELILVPGLAFGRNGDRMGRGAGFYDRFLRGSEALTVGVTDAAGVHDQIPKTSHDVAVDVVLTERGAYRAGTEENEHGGDRWSLGSCRGTLRWTVCCIEKGESPA